MVPSRLGSGRLSLPKPASIAGNRSNHCHGESKRFGLYGAENHAYSDSLRRSRSIQLSYRGSASIVGAPRQLLPIQAPIRLGAYHEGVAVSRKPLLAPGNEAEWSRINRVDAEQLRASNLALTSTQRLELGQELSQQAVSLLAASVKAGNAPRRALWS